MAIEPNPHMHARLRRAARRHGVTLELHAAGAERIGLADASVDVVVSTLVLCTVPDQAATLAEIARVLRPGGRLVFLEHVRGDGWYGAVQQAFARPWRWLFEGCDVRRDTERALDKAGFADLAVERYRVRSVFLPINPQIAGCARRRMRCSGCSAPSRPTSRRRIGAARRPAARAARQPARARGRGRERRRADRPAVARPAAGRPGGRAAQPGLAAAPRAAVRGASHQAARLPCWRPAGRARRRPVRPALAAAVASTAARAATLVARRCDVARTGVRRSSPSRRSPGSRRSGWTRLGCTPVEAVARDTARRGPGRRGAARPWRRSSASIRCASGPGRRSCGRCTPPGRHADALRAYADYEHRLADELGLEPSAAASSDLQAADPAPRPRSARRPPARRDAADVGTDGAARAADSPSPRLGAGPPLVALPGWVSSIDVIASGRDPRSSLLQRLAGATARDPLRPARHRAVVRAGPVTDFGLDASVAELEAVVRPPGADGRLLAMSQAGPVAVALAAAPARPRAPAGVLGTYADGPAVFTPPRAQRRPGGDGPQRTGAWGPRCSPACTGPTPPTRPPRHLAVVLRDSADRDVAAGYLEAVYDVDVTELLPSVRAPALVVHYRGDRLVPFARRPAARAEACPTPCSCPWTAGSTCPTPVTCAGRRRDRRVSPRLNLRAFPDGRGCARAGLWNPRAGQEGVRAVKGDPMGNAVKLIAWLVLPIAGLVALGALAIWLFQALMGVLVYLLVGIAVAAGGAYLYQRAKRASARAPAPACGSTPPPRRTASATTDSLGSAHPTRCARPPVDGNRIGSADDGGRAARRHRIHRSARRAGRAPAGRRRHPATAGRA